MNLEDYILQGRVRKAWALATELTGTPPAAVALMTREEWRDLARRVGVKPPSLETRILVLCELLEREGR